MLPPPTPRAPALPQCRAQQFSPTPQVAGCIRRVHMATPFLMRHSAAPGPCLTPALASPSPLWRTWCLLSQLNRLKWTDSTGKQQVLKNAIFLSNLFPILALQRVSDNSQVMQGQKWAGRRFTEAGVAAANIQGNEDGKWWLPLGQVPHLVGSMALQAGVLPRKNEQYRAGNKQLGKKLVMTALLLTEMWNCRLSRDTFTC